MENKDSKLNKLNLPTLKKPSGGIVKKSDSKPIKPLDLESIKKKAEVNKIVNQDSIKKQMHQKRQENKGLDLVLIGDFTDSMYEYRETLRKKFKELCQVLIKIIPNLRIGIVFYLDHGAYPHYFQPNKNPYITKTHKISVDIESLANFIDSTPIGNGIDWEEAVEDALNDALNMNWNEINTRSIVLFGDAKSHEPNECNSGYDYFELTKKLYNQKVTINTVFCGRTRDYRSISDLHNVDIGDFSKRVSRLNDDEFFSWIANVTGGVAIGVEQMDDIVDIIKAMAAKDAGKIDELEEEIKVSHKPIPALKHIKEKAKQIENKKKMLGIGYDGESS